MTDVPFTRLTYEVPGARPGWELGEETLPESALHAACVSLLEAVLVAWAARAPDVLVVRNLAIRWVEANPRVGVDPDLAVLQPAPPEGIDQLRSLRTWLPGHHPPALAIEVVSETNPRKDYTAAPEKYAASGAGELWIFDPLLSGPTDFGGPLRLQVWGRDASGGFTRLHAGDGPARSPFLRAYAVVGQDGRRLRIADAEDGAQPWATGEEAERAAKEAERAAKEAALSRVAELERRLAELGAKR